jgi:hypothetical protein
MEASIFLSEGFVGAIIGGVVGSVGSYLVTLRIDWRKDKKQQDEIKSLIITDLKSQIQSLDRFLIQCDWLLSVIAQKREILFIKSIEIFKNDVFKSYSYTQYHSAFNEDQFIRIVELYHSIETYKGFNSDVFLKDLSNKRDLITRKNDNDGYGQMVALEANAKAYIKNYKLLAKHLKVDVMDFLDHVENGKPLKVYSKLGYVDALDEV